MSRIIIKPSGATSMWQRMHSTTVSHSCAISMPLRASSCSHRRRRCWSLIVAASVAFCSPFASTYAFFPEQSFLTNQHSFAKFSRGCSCANHIVYYPRIQRPASSSLRISSQLTDIDLTPLYLSSIAGASTCIGAAIVFAFPVDTATRTRSISPQMLSFSLALAGSVMLTVCAVSILPECLESVQTIQDLTQRSIFFAGGAGLYYLLSKLVLPEPEDIILKQWGTSESLDGKGKTTLGLTKQQRRSWRLAVLLFLSLLLHNIPEGFAVAASAIQNDKLGYAVTIAIAMHNIPEGLAISVPCLAARPDLPWLAFVMASVSGLAEPIAALVPLLLVSSEQKEYVDALNMDNVLAFAAGIMILVSFSELLPEARRQLNEDKNGSINTHGLYYYGGLAAGCVLMYGTEAFLASALE